MIIYFFIYIWFFYDVYCKLGKLILEENFNFKNFFTKKMQFSYLMLLIIIFIGNIISNKKGIFLIKSFLEDVIQVIIIQVFLLFLLKITFKIIKMKPFKIFLDKDNIIFYIFLISLTIFLSKVLKGAII
jgi:hypothetical protein